MEDQASGAGGPRKLVLIAAVGLAAVVVLVWMRRSPGDAEQEPTPTVHAVPDADEVTPARAPLEPPPATDGASETRDLVEPVRPVDRTEETTQPIAGPGELLVRTVDTEGVPVANVPVELVITSPMHGGKLSGKAEALTDAAGYAVLTDCGVLLQAAFRPDDARTMWSGIGLELGLRSKLPFGDDDDRDLVEWLETEPPAGEAVVLVLPPHGWIQLEVEAGHDAAGTSLFPDHVVVRRSDSGFYPGWRQGIALDPTSTSHRLGPFGLGWEISVSLSRSAYIGTLAAERIAGPTVAGEVLPVTIRTDGGVAVLGVAVLPSGDPLAGETLRLRLDTPPPHGTSMTRVRTDAAGSWSIWLPPASISTELVLERTGDPLEHRATASLVPLLDGMESLDVGTITLLPTQSPPRLLAAGFVTDAAGQPLGRATVTAHEVTADGIAKSALDRTRTSSSGEFALTSAAPVPSGLVHVYFHHDEYLRQNGVEVPVGSTGLTLALTRGASLSFLVEAEQDLLHWTQLLVRLQGPETSRRLALGELPGDRETGRSRFAGLLAGDYHLSIAIRKTDWVLYEADVTLDAGGAADLGDIDLAGTTRELQVTVVDQHGEAVANERFQLVGDDRRGYRSLETDRLGVLYYLIPADAGPLHLYSKELGDHTIVPGSDPIELTISR